MASKLDKALGTHITIDSTNIPDDVVVESDIGPGAITVTEMAVNSVDSDQYVDGSIDLAHMSVNSIDSDQYVDGSVDNAHIAGSTIEAGKISFFQSAEITGTGSEADTAHGLGRTPAVVIAYITQKDTTTAFDLVEGVHDGTNIKVNVATTAKYKIVAF